MGRRPPLPKRARELEFKIQKELKRKNDDANSASPSPFLFLCRATSCQREHKRIQCNNSWGFHNDTTANNTIFEHDNYRCDIDIWGDQHHNYRVYSFNNNKASVNYKCRFSDNSEDDFNFSNNWSF